MANAKKCDRCKCFYDPYRGVRYRVDGELYSAFSVVLSNAFRMKAFDMCPDCMKETITFIGIDVEKEKVIQIDQRVYHPHDGS